MLLSLRARGLNVRLTAKGKLSITPAKKLTKADRAYIAQHGAELARAIKATAALDTIERQEREQHEREQRFLVEEGARRHRERLAMLRADWLASKDADQVRYLAEQGKLTPEDIALWRQTRDRVEERAALYVFGELLASLTGRTVRIRG